MIYSSKYGDFISFAASPIMPGEECRIEKIVNCVFEGRNLTIPKGVSRSFMVGLTIGINSQFNTQWIPAIFFNVNDALETRMDIAQKGFAIALTVRNISKEPQMFYGEIHGKAYRTDSQEKKVQIP